ncbi:MAG: hypothetical protein ACEROO_09615 [Candidatus Bathyarchaeota archaeon]
MVKKGYLALTAVLLVMVSIGFASADPGIQVSERYFKPGDVVTVTVTGDPGESFGLDLVNTRGLIQTHTGSVGEDGTYVWTYRLNATATTDTYMVLIRVGDDMTEDSFVVSGMTPSQLGETMRMMVSNAKKQAETALIQARKAGSQDDDALNTYREALQILAEAGKSFEEGNYVQTMNQGREALGLFTQVVEGSYNTLDVEPPQGLEQDRNTVKAREAINRLQAELDELKKTTETIDEKGFSPGLTPMWFRRLQGELHDAQDLLDSNQVGEAARQLPKVNNQLKSGRASLQQRQAEIRDRLASRYKTALESRYTKMRDTLVLLEAVDAGKVSDALGEITDIQSRIRAAQDSMQAGNTGEAVRTLWEAERQMREALMKVNGDDTARLLDEIDRLTLQLENQDQTLEREKLLHRIEIATQNLQDIMRSRTDIVGNTTAPTQNNSLTP